MLLPAIPEIMKDFRVPYALAAWIFSGYMIVAAVMTPIAGKLSDIYGKKKVLLTLLVIYVAATATGGFANTISFLLMTRLVQGVGLAAVPAAFSLLRDTFPPTKLVLAVGVFGSAYSGGSVVGLLAGASIIHNFGWHSPFFFIAPMCIAAADHRYKRSNSTFSDEHGVYNGVDTSADRWDIRKFRGGCNCILGINNFIVSLYNNRKKNQFAATRFHTAEKQDSSTVVPYTCGYWDYHVYGISIHSTTGKKPGPTRIWRKCS
jgi:MFS family permease